MGRGYNTACYVQNRIYIRPILNKTAYELFKGKKPSVSYFHQFGCTCYILNTKVHLKKFDAKAYKGIFIGYSERSKAYRVYNSETHTVEESMHIKFDDKQPDKLSELVENFADIQLSDDEESEPEEISGPSQPTSEETNSSPETVDSEDHPASELIRSSPSRVEQSKHSFKYKSSHPEELILGNKDSPRKTRSSFRNEDSLFGLISLVEPSSTDEALADDAWIVAMQEELN